MRKIKICHIISMLGTGGAERLVVDLCKNSDSTKCEIYLIVLFPKVDSIFEKEIENSNFKVFHLFKKKGFHFKTLLDLRKLLNKIKPDIINTHLNSLLYAYLSTRFMFNKPVIFHTVHSVPKKEAEGITRRLYMFLFKYKYVFPIGISKMIKEEIEKTYNIKEVALINNGIDVCKFENNVSLKNRKYDLIHVGRMVYVKNHIFILNVIKLLKDHHISSIKVAFLGDGELKKEIEKKSKELGIEENIDFLGIKANVNEYLSDSKIFLLPSHWEGNPISLIEAIASGCVSIATPVGGVPDVIEEGINGFLIGKDEKLFCKKIIEILSNLDEFEKNRQERMISVRKHDVSQVCENYYLEYCKKIRR